MKFLIAAFFISIVATEELFCTPNSLFQQNCNSCVCSKDGKSATCTDMVCPKEHGQKYCEPGKQFHLDDFSTCICNKDSMTAACTLGLKIYGMSRYLTKNSQYCKPESTFSPDNCNSCICSQDGTNALCTLQMCPVDKPKQVCEAQKSFKNYCNTCFCNDDGLSYSCTRMHCDSNIWNKDGSMKIYIEKSATRQVCEPRKIFKDYCNTCICSDDGLSATCTKMFCDKKIWNQDGTTKVLVRTNVNYICESRKTFNDYCNTCVCSDDGLSAACTRMFCDKKIWNQDGTTKVLIRANVKQVCEPHRTFNNYCNTCVCSDDGLSATCTKMFCDKKIWNQDGTTKVLVRTNVNHVCEPRKTFNDYCNTCVCSDDGLSAACTRMFCDKKIWNQNGTTNVLVRTNINHVCQPRKTFNDYCNTCVCSDDGLSAACTRMFCNKNLWNKDGTNKFIVKSAKVQVCTPRSTFRPDNCNTCKCNEFGTNFICTFKTCTEFFIKS